MLNVYSLLPFLVSLLVIVSGTAKTQSNDLILCADIGSTRIKAALLAPNITLEDLKKVSVITFASHDWLNQDIAQLLNPSASDSLLHRFPFFNNKISLAITGPVWHNRLYLSNVRRIPRNLKDVFERQAGMPVYCENDSINWMRGSFIWHKLISSTLEFPCLAITCGTGIGAAIAYSEKELSGIEISYFIDYFTRLKSLVEEQMGKEVVQRGTHLGRSFFRWIHEEHPEWKEDEIGLAFRLRFQAFLQDMHDHLAHCGIDVKTILVGGGNSRFLSPDDLSVVSNTKTLLLNPVYFKDFSISADLISLLGALPITMEELIPPKQIPDFQEVYDIPESVARSSSLTTHSTCDV